MQGGDLLVQDRPVDPREPRVLGMAGHLAAVQLALDPSPQGDQLGQLIGRDAQSPARGAREGVDRPAVGDVDLAAGGRYAARDHIRGHVSKRDVPHRPATDADARDHAPGRDVDRDLALAISGRRHPTGLDGPCTERDRPVSARGRVAVLVPEQDTELGPFIVRWHEEAPVHVSVAARLVAEQLAHAVDLLRARRVLTPVPDRGARDLERAEIDDPKRLAGGVVIGRLDLDRGSLS